MPKYRCINYSCSQHPPLYQTSFSSKQGCTHYCKICGWGYWTHIKEPEEEEILALLKAYPKLSRLQAKELLSVEIVKPKPPGVWGAGPEKIMLEHLGKFQPFWLSNRLKIIWKKKYEDSIKPPEEEKK